MNYPERQLERWAAYANILTLLVGTLSLVVSVLGVWWSYIPPYIPPYIAPSSPPPVPDGPFQDYLGSELGRFNDKYLGMKRFWGDDAISNLFANFFSRPSLWIPVSLALLLTYFALTRVRSKRSIKKMKE